MFITATCAANSFTPKTPANININSKAHHSRHMSEVVGTANLMNVSQSLNVSGDVKAAEYCSKNFRL